MSPSSPASSLSAAELPPLPGDSDPSSTASPSPAPGSSTQGVAPAEPVVLKIPDSQDAEGSNSPAAVTDAGSSTSGSSYTSGKLDDKPTATPKPTPTAVPDQTPTSIQPASHSPPVEPEQTRLDTTQMSDQQQQQQDPVALTALISRDPSAKLGTFVPDGTSASLTCSIPELVRLFLWSDASMHDLICCTRIGNYAMTCNGL